jgi:hypothetical protein
MATGGIGSPAIPTPRQLELAAVQQAIDNIRARFQIDEAELARLLKLIGANTTIQTLADLQNQVTQLSKQVRALNTAPDVAVLSALLKQPNGFVVLKDGALITRTLVAGAGGVLIQYTDGHDGNPIFSIGSIDLVIPFSQETWYPFLADQLDTELWELL